MNSTNESGYTLISVLLVFLLFTILGVSLTSMSLSSVTASKTEQNHQSAFYIAEAGLNYKYHKIKHDLENELISTIDEWKQLIDHINAKPIVSFDDEDKLNNLQFPGSDEIYADTHVQRLPEVSEHAFEIISIGHQENQSRTVKQTFTLDFDEEQGGSDYELPPFAVFTSGDFTMNNGTIIGDIGTSNNKPGSISFPGGGPIFNGEIYVPDGEEHIVNNNVINISPEIKPLKSNWEVPSLPKFPDFPDLPIINDKDISLSGGTPKKLTLNESQAFDNISIDSYLTLTFDVGPNDKEIIINHLNLINGQIKVEGEGKLTIYIRDRIDMGAGSKIKSVRNGEHNMIENIPQLNIYYKGSGPGEKLTFANDQEIYGSLYAKDADFSFGASGQIFGNLFTNGNNIEISGGSVNHTQLFFAPNANIQFNSGGTLNGRVIGKDVNFKGGGTVKFDENLDNYITGPISIEALEEYNEGDGDDGELPFPSGDIDPDSLELKKESALTEIDD